MDGPADVHDFAGVRGAGAGGIWFPVKEQAEALGQALDPFLGGEGGVGFAVDQLVGRTRNSEACWRKTAIARQEPGACSITC